jgi:drug/metabolite transporter (DMT)-like permease
MLAGLLYVGAGLGLFIYRRFAGAGADAETRLSRRDMPWLAGAIMSGGVAGPALLMLGLAHTQAGTASLLLTLEGVATALIAFAVFREHIGWRNALGYLLIVLGAACLAWRGGVTALDLSGPLLVVGACIAWGVDNNVTRKIANADPAASAMWKGLAAGPVTMALAFASGAHAPSFAATTPALMIGALGYGASLVLFILALRLLGTARTGAYFGTAPFIGATLSVALFAEPVTPLFALAGLLIGAGVFIHLTESHGHEHAHEPMEHAHAHLHDAHHQHAHGPNDPAGEPHAHWHVHARLVHTHAHTPDEHHRHDH